MTEKEAIEFLGKNVNNTALTERYISVHKMAVSALEKQVPKKIIHNPDAGREADYTCPACKWTCSPYARYCQNCGQALYNEKYCKD